MFKSRKNVIFRFNLVVILVFITFAFVIIGNACVIMFKDRDVWNKIKERYVQDNIPIQPERGRILDENGELIISSLPYYKLRIDFVYINNDNQKDAEETRAKRADLWKAHLDEVSEGLHEIFPDESAESFKARLKKGIENKERYFRLYARKVSYTQYNKLMKLPIFSLGEKYSGLFFEKDEDFVKNKKEKGNIVNREKVDRKNIFGDVGMSTFGIVRETVKDSNMIMEMNGLELKYNSYLSGKPGVGRKETNRKGKSITKVKTPAENGMDLQTTINTEMLDICENALKKVLSENHLASGWAILMETKSGDIKAIVNLTRHVNMKGEVEYIETIDNIPCNPTPNHALCRLMEPGSIFKTVAIAAMLDDGRISVNDSVKSFESKTAPFDGRYVTDDMYRKNGTGMYSMAEVLKYSSNIGMVQYIKKAYPDDPVKPGKENSAFVEKLEKMGMEINYRIIDEESTPVLVKPNYPDNRKSNWSKSSLNSMSRGYGVQMTALNTLNFYNAIANGGRMMRPRIVKAVLKDGEVIEEFPTEVINEHVVSKKTADEVTALLVEVVEGKDGTGWRAKSDMMHVAGKTGTANIYDRSTGKYEKDKMMSFCGFFPADKPQYTLIVQTVYEEKYDTRTEKRKLGGGSTAAIAFHEISEKIMAKRLRADIEDAKDRPENYLPLIKDGKTNEAEAILAEMGINYTIDGKKGNTGDIWGGIKRKKSGEGYTCDTQETDLYKIPDLTGMGVKDAVYLLHRRKQTVLLEGYGTIKSQSIPAGSNVVEGDTITLHLEP